MEKATRWIVAAPAVSLPKPAFLPPPAPFNTRSTDPIIHIRILATNIVPCGIITVYRAAETYRACAH
jgi:hypothetical protein